MNTEAQISPPSPIKERWIALDGLRGLAALVVMFSHVGFDFPALRSTGLLGNLVSSILFTFFVPGGMAVQILFVLCGFLMASLYPRMRSQTHFLLKRYSRIFPIYTAVVTYASVKQNFTDGYGPIANIVILIGILVAWHLVWRIIARKDESGKMRLTLFLTFIAVQIGLVLFDIVIGSRFIKDSTLALPPNLKAILMYANNIALTTPFLRYINRYQPTYWSLGLEVLFYVAYALGIGPHIQKLSRLNIWQGVLVIGGCIAILFSLDSGFRTTLELVNLSFNRSSGFLVGIVLGIAYAQKNILHRALEKISKLHVLMFIASILVFACLYFDRTIPHLASYEGMMWYWLCVSIAIGITLYMCVLPHTFAQRLFSSRFLVYWGMISYSSYLLHEHMLPLVELFRSPFPITDSLLRNVWEFTLTGIIASIAYYLVERPYFIWKIPPNTVSLVSTKVHCLITLRVTKGIIIICGVLIVLLAISASFQDALSPRMRGYYMPLTSKWSLIPTAITKLLPDTSHTYAFTSPDNYLASIGIDMQYFGENEKYRKDPNAAHFIIQIFGPDSSQPLSTSDRVYRSILCW
ncbi:MAG: acyltransferase [Candidatus Roizmanbacteria bacterium]